MKGISTYKSNRTDSATPSQVLVMLFETSLVRLQQGNEGIMEGDLSLFRENCTHVRRILTELVNALDYDIAPELCTSLHQIYTWCLLELSTAESDCYDQPDDAHARVEIVAGVLSELLDGWTNVNITGS